MRTKIIYTAILITLTLQSCEKWFDVTASDQIKAEDQFASTEGFKDALIGVYLAMGESSLYGRDMTFNVVDILSQQYAGFTSNIARFSAFQNYNYREVRAEGYIKAMWDRAYFAIANINSALAYMDQNEVNWYAGEKEIIKGELLALRAYLHFDLIRIFGHSDYANRPELGDRMAVPYVTTYSKELTAQANYTETFRTMEADIDAALALLKYDPIYENTILTEAELAEINRNGFYNNRSKRMNYYAVKALQARMYAWQGGDYMEKAALAAEEVIDHGFTNLLKENTNVNNDRKIIEEQLFSLDIASLFATAYFHFRISDTNTEYEALRLNTASAEELYETSVPEIGAVDVRFNTLLTSGSLGMTPIKYIYDNPQDPEASIMPLIKLPEMYYIAAEYYSTHNLGKAINLLQQIRSSRRIVHQLSTSMGLEEFNAELLKEYRKEYVSEGQLFFYYKRKGFTRIPGYSEDVIADDNIYMLPFPAAEIEFGNRVQ